MIFSRTSAARGKAVYRLRLSDEPMPRPRHALRVEVRGDGYRIDTGVVQFTVHRTGPFLETPALKGADLVLKSDQRIYTAGQWQRTQLTVEESSPLKVVLKRTGAHGWADGQERALDYTLRIVAWAGQPSVRLIYSFVNRQGKAMSDFVRLDAALAGGPARREARRPPGWISSRPSRGGRAGSPPAGLGIGLKWWWQLHPKGFEVTPDGRMRLAILPDSARPQNIYMGVAKTHEILLTLDGRSLSAQLEHPVFAVAPPRWYTRDTRALGRLVESSPEAFKKEYWPLVVKYDEWLTKARDQVLAKRDRGMAFRGEPRDEYGMLDFGDAIHQVEEDPSQPDYGVHWETEYYDFPLHAVPALLPDRGFDVTADGDRGGRAPRRRRHRAQGRTGPATTARRAPVPASITGRATRTARSSRRWAGRSTRTKASSTAGS